MKLSANRETILQPLQAVIGVVERRQTMPILANVLLSARNGRLSVTATDLEVELVASVEVSVQSAGDITVPGRKLLDICRALPDGVNVTFAVDGEKAVVRAGRSRFTLSSLPASEFPTIEEISAQQTLELAQAELRALLDQDALLDGAARCPLLPQRHAARDRWESASRCSDRRASTCAVRDCNGC